MTFGAPSALWLLALLPLGAIGYVVMQRRRKKYAIRFTNLDLLAEVATATPRWRRHIAPALFGLAVAALVLALARPQADRRVPKEEAGVVLAFDRSGSMRAEDVEPTRLEAARSAARDFVEGSPDELQIGLVAFASYAEVLAPLTPERAVVAQAVRAIEAGDGTAMGDAMQRSLGLIEAKQAEAERDGESPPFAIVLLSDGANTTGMADPLDVARKAGAARVPVHTIALGTDAAVVRIDTPFGLRSVVVPPDRNTLQAVARQSGGRYFEAPTSADLGAIYDELGAQVAYDIKRVDVTAPVTAAAMVLMLVGGTLSLAWFGKLP